MTRVSCKAVCHVRKLSPQPTRNPLHHSDLSRPVLSESNPSQKAVGSSLTSDQSRMTWRPCCHPLFVGFWCVLIEQPFTEIDFLLDGLVRYFTALKYSRPTEQR